MKIFISSTSHDLNDFRALIVDRLEKRGHEVIYHESPTFPANTGLHSHDHCIKAINQSDIVLCIIDKRYGGIYEGKFDFHIDPFKIKSGDKEIEITVPTDRLSITWCELIEAYKNNKQVMTFARQRTLDEKHTRRKNQDIKNFKPAYVQANEVFDLLDWITKKKTNNWIASFENIVDFERKLITWISEVEKSLVFKSDENNDIHTNESLDSPISISLSDKDSDSLKEKVNLADTDTDYQKTVQTGDATSSIVAEGSPNFMQFNLVENHNFYNRITLIVESNLDKVILNTIVRKLNLRSEINIVSIQGSITQIKDISEFLEPYIESYNFVVVVLSKQNASTLLLDSISNAQGEGENKKVFLALADRFINDWFYSGFSETMDKETSSLFKNRRFINKINHGIDDKFIFDQLIKQYDLELALKQSESLEIFVSLIKKLDREFKIKFGVGFAG